MLSRAERQAAAVILLLIAGVAMVLVSLVFNNNTRVTAGDDIREKNIARGEAIFAANCATCHGAKGQGGVGLPLNIPANHPTSDAAVTQRTEYLTRTLHNGRPGTYMQAWSLENGGPLNSEQINAVVTMLMYGDWTKTEAVVNQYYIDNKSTLAPPVAVQVYTGGVGGNPSLATKGPFPSGVQNPTPAAGTPAAGATPAADATGGAPAKFIGDGHTVNVELKDFAITFDTSLVKPGMTTFKIKNAGPSPHNLAEKATNKASETLDSGKTGTLSLDLKAGSYVMICNIAGHEQLGMKINLKVADTEGAIETVADAPTVVMVSTITAQAPNDLTIWREDAA